jgi:AAHS family 4-hydroxybenzoate transporter-like MFS transporter
MVISSVVSGLPLGAVFGATLAKKWLTIVGWQAMYFYGGIAAFIVLILCVLFLPESAQLLVARARDRDYSRARTLVSKFLGNDIPEHYRLIAPVKIKNVSVVALFTPDYWRLTLGIWGGYFFNFLAWLAIIFWLPTVLVASGMGPSSAPLATLILNLVAAFFIFPLAFVLQRVADVRLLVVGMFLFGILICLSLAFCSGPEPLVLTLIGLAGIGVGLEQMGLYYLAAALYPERLRATGIGWGVALGRIGSIGGAWFGSFFLHGTGVTGFYLGLIPPLVLALGAVLIIPRQKRIESSISSFEIAH